MSGPKVIRVVTREELEAICSRLIARVGAASTDLLRTLGRNELLTDAIEKDIAGRIKALSDQLRAGQFDAVQRQAPPLIAFFKGEKQRYQQLAIAKAEAARKERQQLVDAAASVAYALQQQNKPIPDELGRIIEGALSAKPENVPSFRAEVDKVFRSLLSSAKSSPVASGDLAAKLSGGLTGQSLSQWLSVQPASRGASDRLIHVLSQLEVLEGGMTLAQFATRIAAIDREAKIDRRRLLEDSLVLDVSAALAQRRMIEETRVQVLEVAAELATVAGKELADQRERIRILVLDPDLVGAADFLDEVRGFIKARAAENAAAARRRAVLTGLAGLGYEVSVGMETAWAQEGSIVVAKPGATDYGVELGGPADASRLQVRVVGAAAPVSPRSQQRDTEQEKLWCSEVDELIASLDRSGTELIIERALGIGSQPLKSSALLGQHTGGVATDEVSSRKSRALK
ncbi:hypothetical protein SAMN02983003_2036 [Devosia enhydra]|uniref:Uncharacterized protein n=1 Tax=Devosia enhydra TaxID=665118 RepID=A0A1K2HXM5_9HYPH|nr:hypothetical protein [Devosia enhydra]SFZ84485.1 hypothetical protein SAMN02983003_2036 [Devosia enhydra]